MMILIQEIITQEVAVGTPPKILRLSKILIGHKLLGRLLKKVMIM